MSALGQKRTYAVQKAMSALPPKADMCNAARHVRQGPIAVIQSHMLVAKPDPAKGDKLSIPRTARPLQAHLAVRWLDLMEPTMKKYFPMLALVALAFAPLSKAEQASPLRSAAIHACSEEAAKYLFHVWQTAQFAVYRTCMAKHGQRFD